jgi:putative transposase
MVMHRAIIGIPKTAVVKRTPTGKWFVSISAVLAEEEISQVRQPRPEDAVGIDVGLNSIENP